jgi:hypothetical protein
MFYGKESKIFFSCCLDKHSLFRKHANLIYYSKYASIIHVEIDSNGFREEIEEIYVKLVYLKLKNRKTQKIFIMLLSD